MAARLEKAPPFPREMFIHFVKTVRCGDESARGSDFPSGPGGCSRKEQRGTKYI